MVNLEDTIREWSSMQRTRLVTGKEDNFDIEVHAYVQGLIRDLHMHEEGTYPTREEVSYLMENGRFVEEHVFEMIPRFKKMMEKK